MSWLLTPLLQLLLLQWTCLIYPTTSFTWFTGKPKKAASSPGYNYYHAATTTTVGRSRTTSLSVAAEPEKSDSDDNIDKESVSSSSEQAQPPPPQQQQRPLTNTYSARYLQDNGLVMTQDENGFVTARPQVYQKVPRAELLNTLPGAGASKNNQQSKKKKQQPQQSSSSNSSMRSKSNREASSSTSLLSSPKQPVPIQEDRATIVPSTGFNVVLTHATADFDSLAAAVGLARLWTEDKDKQASEDDTNDEGNEMKSNSTTFGASHVPTFVVLPRGAHPGVARFLALHKHLFPIRSLKSLPDDLSGLNRLALVDAQRRDRLGPADVLLKHANRVTVVDHHVDQESDIPATDYVVDKVGSVSTLMTEHLRDANVALTEAEATLLALGIHADTGSLCFDSTTPRDAVALAWCMEQGASQAAIAEHAHPFLSREQQGVLTQALVNVNSTEIHGVTLSTVLLTADGFINGLAAVAQDALELSSSDVFLLGLVYEAQSGGRGKKSRKKQAGPLLTSRLLRQGEDVGSASDDHHDDSNILTTKAVSDDKTRLQRLEQAFVRKDTDGSGTLDVAEVATALRASGVICSPETVQELFDAMDTNSDGEIDLQEFFEFATKAAEQEHQKKSTTLILIGRAKAGSNLRNVKLNALLEKFGGGGHAKAASATVRLDSEAEASLILQGLVDELVETSLQAQLTVGDFMTAPVLSVKVDMTEKQVEDLFKRFDVRALPVVDDDNDVIGLVTYKEVASAKVSNGMKEKNCICET